MAMSGVEQMMVAMLSKMGIDPEMVKSVALGIQETTSTIRESQERIEAKLDRIEITCELILSEVQRKTDGGFVLGDGSIDDLAIRGLLPDGANKPYPENVAEETQGKLAHSMSGPEQSLIGG